MISNLFFLLLLFISGIKDLRHRKIKHWQILFFLVFILIQIVMKNYLNPFILCNFIAVVFIGWIGYLNQMVGAADVKVIGLSSLYNFYHYDSWWVWYTGLLAGIIDLFLGAFYFHPRGENTPLLFSWTLATSFLYIWWMLN